MIYSYSSDLYFKGCASSPCLNGGTCEDSCYDPYYICRCPADKQGQHCEWDIGKKETECLFTHEWFIFSFLAIATVIFSLLFQLGSMKIGRLNLITLGRMSVVARRH